MHIYVDDKQKISPGCQWGESDSSTNILENTIDNWSGRKWNDVVRTDTDLTEHFNKDILPLFAIECDNPCKFLCCGTDSNWIVGLDFNENGNVPCHIGCARAMNYFSKRSLLSFVRWVQLKWDSTCSKIQNKCAYIKLAVAVAVVCFRLILVVVRSLSL